MKSKVRELCLDYVSKLELSQYYKSCREKVHVLFNSMFKDGKEHIIEEAEEKIEQSINEQFKVYYELIECHKQKSSLIKHLSWLADCFFWSSCSSNIFLQLDNQMQSLIDLLTKLKNEEEFYVTIDGRKIYQAATLQYFSKLTPIYLHPHHYLRI